MAAAHRPRRPELVVVTGASTGVGAATAQELAHRGFHVLAGVRRDADADADALRTDGIVNAHVTCTTSDIVDVISKVVSCNRSRS